VTVSQLVAQVLEAKVPEDVFGGVVDDAALTEKFREYAFQLHPDRATVANAERAMASLSELRNVARARLKAGTYGKPQGPTIRSKLVYTNVVPLCAGDICDVYLGECVLDGKQRMAALKWLRDGRDTDLLTNEAAVLKALQASTDPGRDHFMRYLPRFIERTRVMLGKHQHPANIVTYARGTYTLADVINAYPGGIDPRDAAWMWRRLLEILAWVHRQGFVHGAVTPAHVIVRPETHGARLIDWSYAVQLSTKSHVKALPSDGRDFVAPEMLAKGVAHPGIDVFMAARVHEALLGGRNNAPRRIQNLIEACLLRNPRTRHTDVWDVYQEYEQALRELYGPPKFREFIMPVKL
jgi:serine/threonine protein kinase